MWLPEVFSVHVYIDGSCKPLRVLGKANAKDAWIQTGPGELTEDGALQGEKWLRVPRDSLTPLLEGMPADFEYIKTIGADALK